MKKQNYFSLSVLVSFTSVLGMQNNGTAVQHPVLLPVQGGSYTVTGIHVPPQGAATATKTVSHDKDVSHDTQKFLEGAANREVCKTKMLVEHLRDRIDEDHLKIDKNCWVRPLVGSYTSWSKASSLNTQDAIKELQIIESYVPAECASHSIYHSLAERHRYVSALVAKLVVHEAEQFKNVKGSTVDALLDSQRKIGNLSPVMATFIKQQVRPEIFDRLDRRLVDNIMFLEPDIQLIPLFSHKRVDVDGGDLVTSTDSKYAKSTDVDGNSIIWDLENGCSVNICDHNTWERKRFRERYDQYAVVDGADEHAIFTNARIYTLLTSYPRHIDFVKDSDNDGYLMVLFKRPTKESRLCREAFLNSRGNKEELHQLLNSETFKKIKGFPADNLKFLIEKELEALANQQAKL